MKFVLIIAILVLSLKVYGVNVYPVSVNSEYSSSNPFRGVESISLPNDGELISTYYLTNDDIFDNGNTYLRIHHLPDSPQWDVSKFWPYNHSAQTFTLDIIEVSPGARWRQISTTASGSMYYLGWVNLNTGINSISLSAQGDDRQYAGFLTEGSFKFRKFSHAFAGYTQTNPNFGYEEILVSVPEPQTYGLVFGGLMLLYVLRRQN